MPSPKGPRPSPGSHLVANLYPGADPRALEAAAARCKTVAHLLFSHSRERLMVEARGCADTLKIVPPDLTLDYRVRVRPERMREVVERLREVGEVAAAYIVPAVATPTHACGRLRPRKKAPVVPTPAFTARQGYLKPASEGGVDAVAAWDRPPGGRGAGVEIVHIEGAWNFGHEDLIQNQGGAIGDQVRDYCARQHGTAVLGILGGDVGDSGVTGLCPDALVRGIAVSWDVDPDLTELPAAIRRAANALDPGDIILLQLQHPGPTTAFQEDEERKGYIPTEWWPVTFKAIRYATQARGVIVVEAAGNGTVSLDHAALDQGDVFPGTWKNPFRRASEDHDSGAILVGAGAPPDNPHGAGVRSGNHGPDRSRLPFSNYGSAVDVQAWGKEVTTCGYGSLQGGVGQEHRWYTDGFGGTSSAAPIIAGVLACVQGVLRATKGAPPLTPARARKLLRESGWEQQDAPGRPAASQRIGRRPDLKELIDSLT